MFIFVIVIKIINILNKNIYEQPTISRIFLYINNSVPFLTN